MVNIGSGEGTSINALTERMRAVAGTAPEAVHGEADSTHGSSRVGEVGKAEALLDFRVETDLETGLSKTFNWLKANREQDG